MTEGIFKKTVGAGAQIAQVGLEAARVKDRVEHVVEDGLTAAKRAAKRGRYAAEDLLDETSHCVKQNPMSAVAVSFWAGFGLGAIAVWVVSRNHHA
jgi:ElaB/YqjD/DUF883 family membrane-anchored ribosome-binding protein